VQFGQPVRIRHATTSKYLRVNSAKPGTLTAGDTDVEFFGCCLVDFDAQPPLFERKTPSFFAVSMAVTATKTFGLCEKRTPGRGRAASPFHRHRGREVWFTDRARRGAPTGLHNGIVRDLRRRARGWKC
jgi:hypothetical protein